MIRGGRWQLSRCAINFSRGVSVGVPARCARGMLWGLGRGEYRISLRCD